MTINDIRNILQNEPLIKEIIIKGKTPWQYNKNQKIFKELSIKYKSIFKNIQEIIYLIKNFDNLENLHIFCRCGNKNNFMCLTSGYYNHCSVKCASLSDDVMQKKIKTNLKNRGVEYPAKSKDVETKRKLTCLKRFGVECSFQSKELRDKAQQTLIKKYGVKNYSQSKEHHNRYDEILSKFKQTCLEKFGVEHHFKNNKVKEIYKNSCLKKYGVKNPFASRVVREKCKKSCLERYGSEYYSQSKDYKLNQDKIQYNHYLAMKRNNTTGNSSKIENRLYNKLLNKFQDTIHVYMDKNRYPFKCDFYIPSFDLFIEYNGYWTHGSEPFDKNNIKHLEIIEEWKKKAKLNNYKNDGSKKNQYLIAINVWTIRDPLKLETFKKNNLNYKIFYTEKEFDEWLSSM